MKWRALVSFLLINVHAAAVMAEGPDPSALPLEVRDYMSWTAFPNVPVGEMDPTLCMIPPGYIVYSANKATPKGPHKDKFLAVYFNQPAQEVVTYFRSKTFPVGATIVKERRTTRSAFVDGIGVMVKHERGFDSEVGDWEFMYLDSTGKLTRGNDAAQNCKSCHQKASSSDFVFGNYAKIEIK